MRKLAKQLGVTPMAVYYYVNNKDALLAKAADAVLAKVPRPKPSGTSWRNELQATAIAGFKLLSQYPGLSAQIVKHPPTREATELASYGVSIMTAAGVDVKAAATANTLCQAFMFGIIGMQAQLERAQKKRKRKVAPDAPTFTEVDVQRLAERGLDALLTGFEVQLGIAPQVKTKAAPPARAQR